MTFRGTIMFCLSCFRLSGAYCVPVKVGSGARVTKRNIVQQHWMDLRNIVQQHWMDLRGALLDWARHIFRPTDRFQASSLWQTCRPQVCLFYHSGLSLILGVTYCHHVQCIYGLYGRLVLCSSLPLRLGPPSTTGTESKCLSHCKANWQLYMLALDRRRIGLHSW